LPTPTIYDAIKDAEAITPVYSYRGTENRLRHYERHLPTRLTIDYMDLVLKVLVSDAKVCQAFLEVLHMIELPAVLFHPSIAVKAIGQLVSGGQKVAGTKQN